MNRNEPTRLGFIKDRLAELRLLEDDWFEGGEIAPPKEGLDWLEKAFNLHYPDETVMPHLYPTPEGGISAEWSDNRWDFTLDIHLINKRGSWHGLDFKTGEDDARELDLEDEKDWNWLIEKLDKCLGKVVC